MPYEIHQNLVKLSQYFPRRLASALTLAAASMFAPSGLNGVESSDEPRIVVGIYAKNLKVM